MKQILPREHAASMPLGPAPVPQSQGSLRIPASLRTRRLRLPFRGVEGRNCWRGGGNPPPPASPPWRWAGKARAAEPPGRSSPRNYRKGFQEAEEEELGWGGSTEPGQPSAPHGWESSPRSHRARHCCGLCVSPPLSPERYLSPTLLLLYVFPLLDEKKSFSD